MKKLLVQTLGVKALAVDDNEVNLMIAKAVLEQYGIEVDPVQSGEEAIQKVKNSEYDIIIMDCIMPNMDGYETCLHIRNLSGKRARTPIVAYTSNQAEETLKRYVDVGVEDVLLKPLETIELTKILLKYLPASKMIDAESVKKQLREIKKEVLPDETKEKTVLQKELEQIEDLNYYTGLHYATENEENYFRVLKAACENIREVRIRLQDYTGTGEKQFPEYDREALRIDMHSMKGICACIGLDALSHASAELERTAMQEDEDMEEALLSYVEWISSINRVLHQVILRYSKILGSGEDEKVIAIPKAEYEKLWAETEQAVKECNIDMVQEGLRRLHQATADAVLREELIEAIKASEFYDYAAVNEILRKQHSGI